MPTYVYECKVCGKRFDVRQSGYKPLDFQPCLFCGDGNCKRVEIPAATNGFVKGTRGGREAIERMSHPDVPRPNIVKRNDEP